MSRSGLRAEDVLAIADVSTDETKKIRSDDLVLAGLENLPEGTLEGTIIDWDSVPENTIDGSSIKDRSIEGVKLVLDTVTPAELQDNLPGTIIVNEGIDTAQLADGAVTEPKIDNGAVTTDKIADGAVTDAKISAVDGSKLVDGSVTGSKFDPNSFGGGIELENNVVVHVNDVTAGSANGVTYDEHGHITGSTPILPTELPIATETSIGAVKIPSTGGLKVDSVGNLSHQNNISSGSFAGITYDRHGHITTVDTSGTVPPTSLPIAGDEPTELGAVYIPQQDGIRVDADGAIYHSRSNVTPGTYTKVTVNYQGHVDAGGSLEQTDIPGLDASQIVTGQFGTIRIEDDAITAAKLDDYSTCLMQEDFPGAGEFLGQFWYQPSTAQLRVYSRGSGPQNIWLPVGFGLLQQQNLRFAFTFNATTSTISSITQYGAPLGLAVGDPIPTATDALAGAYGVCVAAGNGITLHDVNGENFTIGDWILCAGETAGWQHIDVADGAGGGGSQFLNDLLDVDLTIRTPQDGDILKYNGTLGQWINVPDTAHASTGATPPNDATPGTLWWDTESGRLFVWYDDGDTTQWVPATPESGLTGGGDPISPVLKVLNDLEDVQAGKFHGALLQYNSGNLRWESTTLVNGGTFAGTFFAVAPDTVASVEPKNLNDLDDVNATNTDKAFLQFNEGTGVWESQLDFDGGNYPVITVAEDFNPPSVIGTATVEKLSDFLDVEVQEIDEAYVIYNDNLNRWEETTTINGGAY